MKDKILIITHSADNECVENVSRFIRENGAEPIRMDVDEYPLHMAMTTVFEGDKWQTFLEIGGEKINIESIAGLWFRRAYNLGYGLEQELEQKFVQPSMGEISQTLYGMIESMPCYRLGRMSLYRRMDSKEEQLKYAHRLGLKVPKTCITNSPAVAKAFVEGCANGAIVKMQSGFAMYEDGVEQVVFTNQLTGDHIDEIDTLKYCPMQFQEKIEKEVELRVTVVGDQVFSFEIDSQKSENAKVDWRKEGVQLVSDWKKHQLPEEIEQQLLALMDFYAHDYGAIDLIKTPQGDYYFLEVNSAGEFFWLDVLCDHAISRQVANVLTGKAVRRGTRSIAQEA